MADLGQIAHRFYGTKVIIKSEEDQTVFHSNFRLDKNSLVYANGVLLTIDVDYILKSLYQVEIPKVESGSIIHIVKN